MSRSAVADDVVRLTLEQLQTAWKQPPAVVGGGFRKPDRTPGFIQPPVLRPQWGGLQPWQLNNVPPRRPPSDQAALDALAAWGKQLEAMLLDKLAGEIAAEQAKPHYRLAETFRELLEKLG